MKNNPSRIVFFDHTDMALRFLFLFQTKQSACFFFCPACAKHHAAQGTKNKLFPFVRIVTSEKLYMKKREAFIRLPVRIIWYSCFCF